MNQLTKHQFKLLKLLANGATRIYATVAGVPADKKQNEINDDFNDILRLVEWGLAGDVSETPKYKGLVERYAYDEGRDSVVIVLNGIGEKMFKRTLWGKWVN